MHDDLLAVSLHRKHMEYTCPLILHGSLHNLFMVYGLLDSKRAVPPARFTEGLSTIHRANPIVMEIITTYADHIAQEANAAFIADGGNRSAFAIVCMR
jgi:hypothetical protein